MKTKIYIVGIVALILLAGAAIVPISIFHFSGNLEIGKQVGLSADIRAISTQLNAYKAINGFYPTNEQGLRALVSKPVTNPKPTNWRQSFYEMPVDPWGTEYVYECPGSKTPNGYDLFSAGPDRKPNTEDDDWGQ